MATMLIHFLGVWLFYWAAVGLLPVRSLYPATTEAFILQVVFVLLVVLGYKLVLSVWRVPRMPDAKKFEIPCSPALIRASLLMSLIGVASLTYDKIYVQRIDFSNGLAVAREAWRVMGEEREGKVSSIFSVFGYLFGSAYYAAVVLAITQPRVLSARQRFGTLFASFMLVMGNSVITGGRSNLLLLATFILSAFSSRSDLHLRDVFVSPFQFRYIKLLIALAGASIIFIFYQRAGAHQQNAVEYLLDFLPFLGLDAEEWYQEFFDEGRFSSLSAMLVLAATYMTHSFATVAAIIDGPSEDKTILFTHASGILYKLGLAARPDYEWFLTGRMPSLPGALWYQWGGLGLIVCGLLLGAASGATTKIWTARRPRQLLPLGLYVSAESTLLLTPMLLAWDFLSFPFVLAAFVMLSVAGYIQRKVGLIKPAFTS